MFTYVGCQAFGENKLNCHLLELKVIEKKYYDSSINMFFRDMETIPKESGKMVDSGCLWRAKA